MTTLVKELEKADLAAQEYARGPAGKNPFVISIQEKKDRPGIFRTWTGIAEVEVNPDRRKHQAVLTAREDERSVTKNIRLDGYLPESYTKPTDQPEQNSKINGWARSSFPIAMGTAATYEYGEMDSRLIKGRGGLYRWDLTVPVTATAPASEQSLLVGMDETHYFVSALPEVVSSVKDAHEILRPSPARKKGTVRQGEWFFVPVTNLKLVEVLMQKLSTGTLRSLETNSSHAAHIVEHGNTLYAIGLVNDNRKGRHEPLLLTSFHRVVRNREVQPLATVPKRQYWD